VRGFSFFWAEGRTQVCPRSEERRGGDSANPNVLQAPMCSTPAPAIAAPTQSPGSCSGRPDGLEVVDRPFHRFLHFLLYSRRSRSCRRSTGRCRRSTGRCRYGGWRRQGRRRGLSQYGRCKKCRGHQDESNPLYHITSPDPPSRQEVTREARASEWGRALRVKFGLNRLAPPRKSAGHFLQQDR
jgi:hypothetical protein